MGNTNSHNLLITVTVFAVTVTVFFILYFILRRRRFSPSSSSTVRVSPVTTTSSTSSSVVVDSLPIFTFSSIKRRSSTVVSGDCAVCLSKFDQNDLLRLLPLCCHAFHTECIDAWLSTNQTCPLCRSSVFATESEIMKIFRPSSASSGNNSFRLEIGNISNRREATATDGETDQRTYSVGAFEYFVDEEAEIPVGNTNRRIFSGEKDDAAVLAVEVETPVVSQASLIGEGNWLKDYVDNLSRAMSFRGSGRFFTGSSRRNDVVAGVGDFDVEANGNGFGEEISEMFRWISGV